MVHPTNAPVPTRWYVRLPEGETYYGRRFHGRTYEIAPQGAIDLRLVDGRGVVAEGPLLTYPGRVVYDHNDHSISADHRAATLRYESSSGNLGGYGETYYSVTVEGMTASVMRRPGEVYVDIDTVTDDTASDGVDRDWLADVLSFVATADALYTISQINTKLSGPDGLPPEDVPISTNRAALVRVRIGRVPADGDRQ